MTRLLPNKALDEGAVRGSISTFSRQALDRGGRLVVTFFGGPASSY
jgi:hypothetical protein